MAQEKRILIVVAGSNGEAKELALSPGSTVQEALDESNLQGYTLSYKGEPLKSEEDLYARVGNGDKVQASLSEMVVGLGGSASLNKIPELFNKLVFYIKNFVRNKTQRLKIRRRFKRKRARLIGVRKIRRPGQPKKARLIRTYKVKIAKLTGTSKEKEYWQDREWKRKNNEYRGYFNTELGRWRGLIRKTPKNEFEAFIFTPPDFLINSSHGECFRYERDGVFNIHFPEVPTDPNSTILAIERVIHDAFEEKRNGGNK